ncbi:MAG: hypothetical protein INR70_07345 [Parafilimonas terrae]|nr:hypothetical protein [Parafilimonas terrae]
MSRLNDFMSAVVDLYRLYNQKRLQLFYRFFQQWFLVTLFGGTLSFFGLMLIIFDLIVGKFSWIAAVLGVVALALGVTLLRHANVLHSRR